jgi:hypothetical protein
MLFIAGTSRVHATGFRLTVSVGSQSQYLLAFFLPTHIVFAASYFIFWEFRVYSG